jgi:hypothetical protein
MISKVKCMAKILCLLADVDGQRRTIDWGNVNAYTVRNIWPMALAVFRVFPPRSTRWNATLTVS